MAENEIEGAALQPAADDSNPMEATKQALLTTINTCQELSTEVEKWINHVKENGRQDLPILKSRARAGAKAYVALEKLQVNIYQLQDRWLIINTAPELQELEELPEDALTYNLANARLTLLITGWNNCLVKAQTCFYGFSRQNALSAAELSLAFLNTRSQEANFDFFQDDLDAFLADISVYTPDEPLVTEDPDQPVVDQNAIEEPQEPTPTVGSPVRDVPRDDARAVVTPGGSPNRSPTRNAPRNDARAVTTPPRQRTPNHSSSPRNPDNILNLTPIPGRGHDASLAGSLSLPEALMRRIVAFNTLV